MEKIFTDESKGNDLAAKSTPLSPNLIRKYSSDALPTVLCGTRATHIKLYWLLTHG